MLDNRTTNWSEYWKNSISKYREKGIKRSEQLKQAEWTWAQGRLIPARFPNFNSMREKFPRKCQTLWPWEQQIKRMPWSQLLGEFTIGIVKSKLFLLICLRSMQVSKNILIASILSFYKHLNMHLIVLQVSLLGLKNKNKQVIMEQQRRILKMYSKVPNRNQKFLSMIFR